jgi:glycosyltransferase involved in cell wall biosynthesis
MSSVTPQHKKIILLQAPILSRSGYGEHARLVYESLLEYENQLNIRVSLNNWGHTPNDISYFKKYPSLRESLLDPQELNTFSYDVVVHVGIPNEFPLLTAGNNKKMVGITAGIETDIIDDSWADIPARVDALCVVSQHAKSGFIQHARRNHTNYETEYDKKIQVIPYPVKTYELDEEDHILEQMDLSTNFNFLSVAQMGPRKNMDLLVRAFVEEFHDEPDVGLVLKTNLVNNSRIDKEQCLNFLQRLLSNYPHRQCKIHHIHGNLNEKQLHSLYISEKIDTYVTTTHGEGFGLPIFEAAYSGLPVIAPAWSGHCDFLYAPQTNEISKRSKMVPHFTKLKYTLEKVDPAAVWKGLITPESKWATCDMADTKKKMRSFYVKNHNKAHTLDKKNATLLQQYLVENFTKDKILKLYQEQLIHKLGLLEGVQEIEEWGNFISEMIE